MVFYFCALRQGCGHCRFNSVVALCIALQSYTGSMKTGIQDQKYVQRSCPLQRVLFCECEDKIPKTVDLVSLTIWELKEQQSATEWTYRFLPKTYSTIRTSASTYDHGRINMYMIGLKVD
jgi:hypothetical protein